MRQSDKIKYMLTSQLTEDELKNVIHYSFSNRPIDTALWYDLLNKLDLTDEDITEKFHDKIKNLVYDAFIIKRIDYDEVSYNLSLLRAKKYIDNFILYDNINDLIRGWILYTSTDKCYFYPNAWKEPEQNKILDFFNIITTPKIYRNNDLTLMFCVYVVSKKYKRNISDYERFESTAKLLEDKLLEIREIYDTVRNHLIKLTNDLYGMSISQSSYNLIEATSQTIYNYVYDKTSGSVTTRLNVYNIDDKITLLFNFDIIPNHFIKTTGIGLIFELLNYDILYFNTYGTFFNCLYS